MSVGSGLGNRKGRSGRCQLALGVLDEPEEVDELELDDELSDEDVEAVDELESPEPVDAALDVEPVDEDEPRLSFL